MSRGDNARTKPLPHTLCVKGHWYFRAPKTRSTIKLEGQPGDQYFMQTYRRLMAMSGAKAKRQKQKQRIKRAEARAAADIHGSVYFIGIEPDGPVKIGKALNVEYRLSTLQVAVPYELKLLAVTDGGRVREKEYHARFAASRIRGEWFERVPDLLAEISSLGTNEGEKGPEKTFENNPQKSLKSEGRF